MTYLFPFADVEKGSKILLYGAGAVGYEFYRQLQTSGYCELVKWVDGQYQWYQYLQMPVDAPESAADAEVDMVVVAVERREVYLSIRKHLEAMGIAASKILWKDNYRLIEEKRLTYDPERARQESLQAVCVSPRELLDENRMDIIVRYLYAKALLEQQGVEEAGRLYEKLVTAIHRGEEPLGNGANAYFSDYEQKRSLRDFDEAFRALLQSMQEQGYQREKFIPLDADGKMINGSHRLAAALALEQKVWVLRYELFKGKLSFLLFSLAWLRANGFTEEELALIERTFTALKTGA